MPFGGAGGLIAVSLAERLGIKEIVVPWSGGVFSAFGMLFSDYTKETLKSILKPYSAGIPGLIRKEFTALKKQILPVLAADGFSERDIQWLESVEMRYKGQSYELTVNHTEDFLKEFHERHQQLYSYTLEDTDCEIVNIRLRAVGRKIMPEINLQRSRPEWGSRQKVEKKEVFYEGELAPFNFYRRQALKANSKIDTPAVITSEDSTVIINSRFSAEIDEYFNLIIRQKGAR
jgi:N-methylhydantoinase A